MASRLLSLYTCCSFCQYTLASVSSLAKLRTVFMAEMVSSAVLLALARALCTSLESFCREQGEAEGAQWVPGCLWYISPLAQGLGIPPGDSKGGGEVAQGQADACKTFHSPATSSITPEMLPLLGMKQGKSSGYTCLPIQV